MTVSRWTTAASVMLAATLAAAAIDACGSSSGSSSSQTANANAVGSARSGSTSAAVSPVTTTGSIALSASGGQALTKPGSTLKLGETAHVQWSDGTGPNYSFAITVSSIRSGSMSDFKDISLTGVPRGATPTYVKLTITNIGKTPLRTSGGDPAYSMGADEPDGLDGSLSLTGDFPPCPQAASPKEYLPGHAFLTCQIYMERGNVGEIGYDGSESTIDTPILWSRSMR